MSKLNAQAAQLQTTQNQLNAKLIQLKKLKNSNLQNLHNEYSALVPATPSTSAYLKQINGIVNQSGTSLKTLTVSTPTAATAVTPGGGTASATSSALLIPVTLSVTGTYDQNLKLMQLIYQASRLTTINAVTLAGGGPGSNRGSTLSATFTMTIYELPGSTATSTTTTTTAAV